MPLAQRLNAYLVFLDESGFLLLPRVRRTWAPRGMAPIVRQRYRGDKLSAISAVTVSPQRHRCGLYAHFHCDNISQVEVALFLRLLLRHLAGAIIVLWDGGSIHGGPAVTALLAPPPRLHVERFPPYAPELQPDQLLLKHPTGALAKRDPGTGAEILHH